MGFAFFAYFSWYLVLYALAMVFCFVLLTNNCHLPVQCWVGKHTFFMCRLASQSSVRLQDNFGPAPSPGVGIMLLSARSFGIGSLNIFPPSSGRIPFNEDPNPNPHSSGPSTPLKNQIYSFSPSKSYSRQSSSSDTDLSLTPKTGKVLPPTLFWFVYLFGLICVVSILAFHSLPFSVSFFWHESYHNNPEISPSTIKFGSIYLGKSMDCLMNCIAFGQLLQFDT